MEIGRIFTTLAVFILPWTTVFAATDTAKPVHVVFDIDDTFAFSTGSLPASESVIVVSAGDQEYSIPKAFLRSVETLLKLDEGGMPVKISFYSAGTGERNRALLSAIRLSDGRSLFDISNKVLNREDRFDPKAQLDSAGNPIDKEAFQPAESMFRGQFKKDLRKIDADLERVIFVDDDRSYALAGQEKSHLAVFWSVYDEPGGEVNEWQRISGLLVETIRDVAKGKSVPDALYARQFENGWDYRSNYRRYERAGGVVMKATEENRIQCSQLFQKLLVRP
jgi:hypothetical protein